MFLKGRVLGYACDSHFFFPNRIAVGKARLQQGAVMVPITFHYEGTLVLGGSLFELRSFNQMMLKENEFEIGRRQKMKMYVLGYCNHFQLKRE